jgi:pilus assembly protein CpaE
MIRPARVIIFNADEDYSAKLREALLGIPGVQIVAEVDELTLIPQLAEQFSAEMLFANLDPTPDAILPTIAMVAKERPELAVFVASESTDSQHLLMALRAGVAEFLTKPIEREQLSEAIGKIAIRPGSRTELGKLIPILGTEGGVGTSTLAVNLAVELAEFAQKKPVAVVDLDFRFGQLGTLLDLRADYTIADLCDTPERIDQAIIEKAMVKHASGVHLLARPNQFAQADQITAAHCTSVLSSLQQMYEYIVVDGPTRFDVGGLSILDMSDTNLLLIQLLVTSVRNVNRIIEELRNGGCNLDRFRIVCNRVGRDSAHLTIGHVEDTLKRRLDFQIPEDWRAVSAAVNMGMPLKETAPKSRVRAAIREMAEIIADPTKGENDGSGGKGSLLNRIFNGAP